MANVLNWLTHSDPQMGNSSSGIWTSMIYSLVSLRSEPILTRKNRLIQLITSDMDPMHDDDDLCS